MAYGIRGTRGRYCSMYEVWHEDLGDGDTADDDAEDDDAEDDAKNDANVASLPISDDDELDADDAMSFEKWT